MAAALEKVWCGVVLNIGDSSTVIVFSAVKFSVVFCLTLRSRQGKHKIIGWNTSTVCVSRQSVDQLQSELRMEMATWQLLYVLSRDRAVEGEATVEDSLMEVLLKQGTSDKEIADHLFTRDSSVRQAQVA